ncbi:reverse transcriptase domain-containing protein [Tanacetum coccineum]
MHSYAIRLNFNGSDHAMDCEALLVGLIASVSKGMKELYVFIDSLTLVAQIEGNHAQSTKHERKYKEEIMDATILFHRIPQPRSFSGNQDKTIDQSGKSSTQGASEKA